MIEIFILSIKHLVCLVKNSFSKAKLFLISEGNNWSINEDCKNIKETMDDLGLINSSISLTPYGLKNKILHFASENMLIGKNGIKYKNKKNKLVFTWFHISKNDNFRLKYIPLLNTAVNFVHTACNITKEKLIINGLQENKLVVIPLGVNLEIFNPISEKEKKDLRIKLNLPTNKIIIGSFQKDGNGWGEGLKPKLIKGPDIFCNVIEKLSKKHGVYVMLTGPARGYVKNRLKEAKIPYSHIYLKNYYDISQYYKILDLYLICSREEGGPKALLESMASGIPLVSTHVGMVPDIIENNKDGFIVNIENENEIFEKANLIINDRNLRELFIRNSLEKIKKYEIEKISREYYDKIYSKII
jgi:glycosyltransferase involved in cell wall biosynthesis